MGSQRWGVRMGLRSRRELAQKHASEPQPIEQTLALEMPKSLYDTNKAIFNVLKCLCMPSASSGRNTVNPADGVKERCAA